MVNDAGIDFDKFIDQIADGKTDQEIAETAGVSAQVIRNFREHFEKYGVDSIMGQD